MNYSLLPVPISVILIVLYLIARNRNDLKRTAFIQPALTLLSVIIAALSFLSPQADKNYTIWILVGLGLCLLADIFNIDMDNDKILFAAIGVFIVAYLEYAITYTLFNHGFYWQDLIVGGIFILIYILLMRLYWKGLGKYRAPVMIYGLFMPFMVTRAISTLFGTGFSLTSAGLVTAGSVMLFLGDAEYGLSRFHKPLKFFFGPIFYAGGQLLIALSCTFFIQ
jgi:uncharacterized membrane protein YhhN